MGRNNFCFPDSVTTIGEYAFEGCYALQSINIPSRITKIEECAFKCCTALQNIIVSNNNPNYTSLNGVLYDKELKNIITFPCKKDITEYTIPNSVTTISDSAFECCQSLKIIWISNSVSTIGNNAFKKCLSLQAICLQCTNIKNVNISDNAFNDIDTYNCILHIPQETNWSNNNHPVLEKFKNIKLGFSLNKEATPITKSLKISKDGKTILGVINEDIIHITIPNEIMTIGECAFMHCSSLQSVEIPSNVISIKLGAFCIFSLYPSLQKINVSHNNNCYASIDGILFNKNLTAIIAFPSGIILKKYKIPNSVTTIESGAFFCCVNLQNIEIPDSVITIQEEAFGYCHQLTSVIMPDSIIEIRDWAFNRCISMQNLNIPNSVTSIGNYAFSDCSALKSIHIHITNIEKTCIGNNAFEGIDTASCILYVPPGTRWTYRHHPVFSKFKNIEIE